MLAEIARHPVMLKLALAMNGVASDGDAEQRKFVELTLGGGMSARARINPESRIKLTSSGVRGLLADDTERVDVRLAPVGIAAQSLNGRGASGQAIVEMQGRHANVALNGGCGLGSIGRVCSFCQGRELTEKAGEMWPAPDVLAAVRIALSAGSEFVHFQLGYVPAEDAGVMALLPYLNAVLSQLSVTAAVTMHPPQSLRSIDIAYARGVDLISFNLEAPDAESMAQRFPGRARFIGRDRYIDALRYAAQVFPSGAVWSQLLIDLAPPDATMAAIDELVSIGVVPMLGVSPAAVGAQLDARTFEPLLERLFEATAQAGINMAWARDLSTSIAPADARSLVRGAAQFPPLLEQIARNRFGAIAARSLARLRRRLRVRKTRIPIGASQP